MSGDFNINLPPHTHTHAHPHCTHSPGNHESITMNQMYGFEGEVKSKYSATMADLFTELFEWLPLAHCIERKILVHGKYCVYINFNNSWPKLFVG